MVKDDKFIMMNLDDERSKNIADVLGNKTCRKIIDYLSDVKEASEKDIADALSMPLNTVEYNLNKLIKSGLIEKTKNFFWSVKGRKIDMYKLANKHIIISPKSKPKMEMIKTIVPVVLIAAVLLAIVGYAIYSESGSIINPIDSKLNPAKQFNSLEELSAFLNASSSGSDGNRVYAEESFAAPTTMNGAAKAGASLDSSTSQSGGGAGSYSKTNIQVEGVDEADIVKNDGKYIYALSGNKISIVKAYPASEMRIESEINVPGAREIFVNGDRLIVFGENYNYISYGTAKAGVICMGCGGGYGESKSSVYIYDISNRANPVLARNISFDGNYLDSRMIEDYVYLISSKYIYADRPVLPMYEVNGVSKSVGLSDIYYFDYVDNNYVFSSISAINLDNDEVNSKVYMTGGTGTIYVSQNNIFLTYQKTMNWRDYNERKIKDIYLEISPDKIKEKINEVMSSGVSVYEKQAQIYQIVFDYSNSLKGEEKADFDKKLSDKIQEFEINIAKENQKTVVHKINIDKLDINYKTMGEVPGYLLNQFSMDEHDNYFRAATTTGEIWNGNSLNNIYVLDEELKIVGKIEDLAKGEKIYSARFIGKRAYMVTFKKTDPFYVIDLSDEKNPRVLGYLKIPGYSDYLHPYDENHIIGVGKEAVDASSEETSGRNDFAWYQGVKVALFDVSDVANPKELSKFVIGDRGTDSSALYEHKAFLFDKEKGILAIPITLAQIDRSKYKECSQEELRTPESWNYCLTSNTYGQQVWQGVYVLNIDLNGISLRGRVSHDEENKIKYGSAKDEPIGATRKDWSGNLWTKIESDKWTTSNYGYEGSIWNDYIIDTLPGGVNYNYMDYRYQIQRSLYMDNVFYSVSQARIKANDLNNLNELNKIDIGYSVQDYPVYAYAMDGIARGG